MAPGPSAGAMYDSPPCNGPQWVRGGSRSVVAGGHFFRGRRQAASPMLNLRAQKVAGIRPPWREGVWVLIPAPSCARLILKVTIKIFEIHFSDFPMQKRVTWLHDDVEKSDSKAEPLSDLVEDLNSAEGDTSDDEDFAGEQDPANSAQDDVSQSPMVSLAIHLVTNTLSKQEHGFSIPFGRIWNTRKKGQKAPAFVFTYTECFKRTISGSYLCY